jgi:hypothetical protein
LLPRLLRLLGTERSRHSTSGSITWTCRECIPSERSDGSFADQWVADVVVEASGLTHHHAAEAADVVRMHGHGVDFQKSCWVGAPRRRAKRTYNSLANCRLQPLGHVSTREKRLFLQRLHVNGLVPRQAQKTHQTRTKTVRFTTRFTTQTWVYGLCHLLCHFRPDIRLMFRREPAFGSLERHP